MQIPLKSGLSKEPLGIEYFPKYTEEFKLFGDYWLIFFLIG